MRLVLPFLLLLSSVALSAENRVVTYEFGLQSPRGTTPRGVYNKYGFPESEESGGSQLAFLGELDMEVVDGLPHTMRRLVLTRAIRNASFGQDQTAFTVDNLVSLKADGSLARK